MIPANAISRWQCLGGLLRQIKSNLFFFNFHLFYSAHWISDLFMLLASPPANDWALYETPCPQEVLATISVMQLRRVRSLHYR